MNKEKIIKALICCDKKKEEYWPCTMMEECPYKEYGIDCEHALRNDIIILLEKNEKETNCERHPSEPPVSDLYLKRPNHCPLKKAQEIVQCKDCYKQKICYPEKDELQPEFYCADGKQAFKYSQKY